MTRLDIFLFLTLLFSYSVANASPFIGSQLNHFASSLSSKAIDTLLNVMDGNAEAQNEVAAKFYFGYDGFPLDKVESVQWFRKSADQGNALGQLFLAHCYSNGIGVEKDETVAFDWLRKSATQENVIAQYKVGKCYFQGKGVDKYKRGGFSWFHRAALNGHSESSLIVGLCYLNGVGIKKHEPEAFDRFQKLAQMGNTRAQRYLGRCFQCGIGCDKDDCMAAYWYEASAAKGDIASQNYLGLLYAKGSQKDFDKALDWFKKSAEMGNSKAQYCVGLFFAKGLAVDKDYCEAFKWFMKSAEQGHAQAQYFVGSYYYLGFGVDKNLNQAFHWYQKSSEQDYAYSLQRLAACYENGSGVAVDKEKANEMYQKAFNIFTEAANNGDANALLQLSHFYRHGRGVEKNLSLSAELVKKSAELKKNNENNQWTSNASYQLHKPLIVASLHQILKLRAKGISAIDDVNEFHDFRFSQTDENFYFYIDCSFNDIALIEFKCNNNQLSLFLQLDQYSDLLWTDMLLQVKWKSGHCEMESVSTMNAKGSLLIKVSRFS